MEEMLLQTKEMLKDIKLVKKIIDNKDDRATYMSPKVNILVEGIDLELKNADKAIYNYENGIIKNSGEFIMSQHTSMLKSSNKSIVKRHGKLSEYVKFKELRGTSVVPKEIDETIKCPKCGSTNIYIGKKGYGVGKALVTSVIINPLVGLGVGALGRKNIECTCVKCNTRFENY